MLECFFEQYLVLEERLDGMPDVGIASLLVDEVFKAKGGDQHSLMQVHFCLGGVRGQLGSWRVKKAWR